MFYTQHEGEVEGEVPSHVVTGRMQGHSFHQMQRSWCIIVNWYPPALSISLDSEEGAGRVQWTGSGVLCGICGVWCVRGGMCWKVWDEECCEVWDMWSAV